MHSQFLQPQDPHWEHVPALRVGSMSVQGAVAAQVGITQQRRPLLRIDIDAAAGHACFSATHVSHGLVAIGYGQSVFVIDPAVHATSHIKLDGYFGQLYPASDFPDATVPFAFLVTSAAALLCINTNGQLAWQVHDLGVDGVLVHAIAGELLDGSAEWDPPGGWVPFTLRMQATQATPLTAQLTPGQQRA